MQHVLLSGGKNHHVSYKKTSRRGFTIVELLIVIVVVAILAAISIVAYTGIQDRARATSATVAAKQVASKVGMYMAENEVYPSVLSDIGFSDSGNTTYQYRVNNSDDPKTWCVTATVVNKSFYASNFETVPREGGCSGHGIGGSQAVTNYVTNPSAEGSANLLVSTGAPNITISNDTASGWPRSGTRSYKIVATTANETRVRPPNNIIPLDNTKSIQASFYVYNASTGARNFAVSFQGRTSAGAVAGYSVSEPVSVSAQSIARVSAILSTDSYGIFSSAAHIEPMVARVSGAANDVFYVDDVYISYGAEVNFYADGNTSGWTWNGTPNNSTSTGPARS